MPSSALNREMGGFTASELEMLAGDDEVEIVPNFSFQEAFFLSGNYGPFQAKIPARVPLWLALQLKHRQLCSIRTPEWLEKRNLADLVTEEDKTRGDNVLSSVDFHYQEKAALLFRHCPDSFSGEDGDYNPRVPLRDFEEMREAKLHTSLRELNRHHDVVDIANISAMEINSLRDFLVASLHQYQKIQATKETLGQGDEEELEDSQAGASL